MGARVAFRHAARNEPEPNAGCQMLSPSKDSVPLGHGYFYESEDIFLVRKLNCSRGDKGCPKNVEFGPSACRCQRSFYWEACPFRDAQVSRTPLVPQIPLAPW